MSRTEEDDEDAKTVLMSRRRAEVWQEYVADMTTPTAQPERSERPVLVDDGSLDDDRPATAPRVVTLAVDVRLLAIGAGLMASLLLAGGLLLLL